MLVLLLLWLLLELSRIELQIVAVYMVSLVSVYNYSGFNFVGVVLVLMRECPLVIELRVDSCISRRVKH